MATEEETQRLLTRLSELQANQRQFMDQHRSTPAMSTPAEMMQSITEMHEDHTLLMSCYRIMYSMIWGRHNPRKLILEIIQGISTLKECKKKPDIPLEFLECLDEYLMNQYPHVFNDADDDDDMYSHEFASGWQVERPKSSYQKKKEDYQESMASREATDLNIDILMEKVGLVQEFLTTRRMHSDSHGRKPVFHPAPSCHDLYNQVVQITQMINIPPPVTFDWSEFHIVVEEILNKLRPVIDLPPIHVIITWFNTPALCPHTCRISKKNSRGAKKLVIIDTPELRSRVMNSLKGVPCIDSHRQSIWQTHLKVFSLLGKVLGTLCGPSYFAASRAIGGFIGKKGLVSKFSHYVSEGNCNLMVAIFVSLASNEFSGQKLFTLESQMQGGISPTLIKMYNFITKFSLSQKDLLLLYSLVPNMALVNRLDDDSKQKIFMHIQKYFKFFIPFLENQLVNGAWEAFENGGRVHAKSYSVQKKWNADSGGWNMIADGMNNLYRMLNYLRRIRYPIPEWMTMTMRIPVMIADDQYRWGQDEGKKDDVNETVSHLAKEQIRFWGPMIGIPVREWADKIRMISDRHQMPVDLWLPRWLTGRELYQASRSKPRMGPVQHQPEATVCGIPVHPWHAVDLKASGAFGATPHTGT